MSELFESLISNEGELVRIGANAKNMAIIDAKSKITDIVVELIRS